MNTHDVIKKIKQGFNQCSLNHKIAIVAAAFLAFFFLIKFLHFLGDLTHHYRRHHTALILIRENQKIIIPQDSPLRARLLIKPVYKVSKPHKVQVPGIVEANPKTTLNVFAPVPGRLVEIAVQLGDKVVQGQVLARILSGDMAQALSDKDKAKAMLLVAELALKRAQAVQNVGGNALKDVQLAQMNYTQAQAEWSRAEARLKALGDVQSSRLEIKAPLNGQINTINQATETYLNDLTQPLMTVSNIHSVYVTAYVPENLVATMALGQAVKIRLSAYPSLRFKGKIDAISNVLEQDIRRNKVRILIDNKKELMHPNMFASVEVVVPEPPFIMLPNSAIIMNNENIITYVETAPWTFLPRTVTLGTQDEHEVRILSGLSEGDRVLMQGGVFIND